MKPQADFDPRIAAKKLMREGRSGALATVMPGSGDPYCSLVNVASAADGSPLILISRLAIHTKNILADNRVSLMLDERKEGDPLEGARVMLMGRALVSTDENDRRRYLARQPEAEMFAGFADFAVYRIEISTAHLVAGFGRIVDLKPQDILVDVAGADDLLAAEQGAVEPHERGPRRRLPAVCDQAAGRTGRGMALRRPRPGRTGTAKRARRAAAAVSPACKRAGSLAGRAGEVGSGGAGVGPAPSI